MERSVKSRANRRPPWLVVRRRAGLLAIMACGVTLAESAARADKKQEHRPLLLGGSVEVHRPQVRLDPLLPHGERIGCLSEKELPLERCSLTRAACVHGADPEELTLALDHLEFASELLDHGARLAGTWPSSPGPEALHWSLTDGPLTVRGQPAPSRGFDRAEARCEGGRINRRDALRCMAEASLMVRSPASASWLRAGLAELITDVLLEAPPAVPPWVNAQRRPEDGVLVPADDGRSGLFFEYLMKFSAPSTPLWAPLSAFLAPGTRTPPGSLRYEAEPDLLDALRVNLEGDRARFARLMDDFAVYRWLRGREVSESLAQDSDGGSGEREPSALPRLAWDIEAKSLPRTLVLQRPLTPSGSAYVRVHLAPDTEGYVALRTYCETPVSYVWSILLLDERGDTLRHVPIPFQEGASNLQARVGDLGEATSLLAIGTNLGGVDLAHPFDPDHGPHEEHGCRLTFNRMENSDDDGAVPR